jgi:hypothetical protein
MTPVEREMPQRMLWAAVAFFQAGSRCALPIMLSPGREHSLGAPTIVNYAFSIELYLKLLLLLTSGRLHRGNHDLFEIYKLLGQDVRERITRNTRFPGDETYVPEALEDLAKVFVEWRYAYEQEFLVASPDTMVVIATALHRTVKEVAGERLVIPD